MTTIEIINKSGHPLTQARPGDAGCDLRACTATPRQLEPGRRWVVPTGISLALPPGFCGLVLPRSGLARDHGVATTTGVIDSGYRGEISVVLINHGDHAYTIVPGERIAQLVIGPVTVPLFVEVDKLPDSERGASGFGSTGR